MTLSVMGNASESLNIFAGLLNVTDEEPPWMRREMNYDSLTHNPFGRIVKVGVR